MKGKNKYGKMCVKLFLFVLILLGRPGLLAEAVTYSWPMDVSIVQKTHKYGYPGHTGCDFSTGTVGKPVYAVADGKAQVIDYGCQGSHREDARAEYLCPKGTSCKATEEAKNGSYGNRIIITHSNGAVSYYCHLLTGRMQISDGDMVKQGQLIGYSGTSGNSSGPHLHFELRNVSYSRCPCELLTKVNVKPVQISVLGDNPQLYVNDIYGYAYQIEGDASGLSVKWTSSAPEVASVDQNGAVKARGVGTAVITAALEDGSGAVVSSDTRTVTVKGAELEYIENSITIKVGQKITPRLRKDGIQGTIKYSSDKSSVASVDSNGKISGKAVGTAKITAKYGNSSTSCTVKVKPAVSLSKNKLTLYRKKTATLEVSVKGSSQKQKPVWKSSKSSVVSVKGKGKKVEITAKKAGTANITVTVGGSSAKCRVTVKNPTIKLNKKTVNLNKGKTCTLKADVKGPSKKVTWTSSNTKIATVSKSGKVTAKKKGTVRITAKANGVTAVCKVKVTSYLTRKQAEKAVNNYVKQKETSNYYYFYEGKEGKYYTFWVTYRGVFTKAKYFVHLENGKAYTCGPYLGVNEWKKTDKKRYKFNAYKYL